MQKKLNKQEIEKFKELYAKHYSARYIFKMLGQEYSRENALIANERMIKYRKKLGLPKRKDHSKTINCPPDEEEQKIILQQLELRTKSLKMSIAKAEKKIENWHDQIAKNKIRLIKLKEVYKNEKLHL